MGEKKKKIKAKRGITGGVVVQLGGGVERRKEHRVSEGGELKEKQGVASMKQSHKVGKKKKKWEK